MKENNLYTKEDFYIMMIRRGVILAFLIIGAVFIKFSIVSVSPLLFFVLIFWILTSIPFEIFLRKIKTRKTAENANFYYFLLELFFLTISIYYIGGIAWYGGVFYSITIVFVHFILPRKRAIELTLIANFIFFDGLVLLEFLGIVSHQFQFFEMGAYNDPFYVLPTMLFTNFALMFLGGVLSFFANILKSKKESAEKATRELEERKKVLEIQVRARTRQADENTSNLKNLVKERTKDLNLKIKELEKFYNLTKGREETLIKLERKAEKLRTMLKIKKGESNYV